MHQGKEEQTAIDSSPRRKHDWQWEMRSPHDWEKRKSPLLPIISKIKQKASHELRLQQEVLDDGWDIFKGYLTRLNTKMQAIDRKILMFLDNCPAHPKGLSFSNIELEYLPKNTTSVLQPMDQGIIRSFKCHYRKRLIRHVLLQIQESDLIASNVEIDVMQAMRWSLSAWDSVTKTTVFNCFKKAGFKTEDDHFDSDTETEELQTFSSSLLPEGVSLDDYASVDDELVVTDEVQVITTEESESEDEEEEEQTDPKPSKADALNAFRLLVRYNEYESFVSQDVIDKMERRILKHAIETKVQTKITDYFAPEWTWVRLN